MLHSVRCFPLFLKLVETMAESTEGVISYNEILDDLKEIN